MLSGDDSLALPVIAAGANGVISVVANEAPDLMSCMVDAALRGDYGDARTLHYRLLPLMQANFVETNPVPVKVALEMMGRLEARYRLPLVPLDSANEPHLRHALAEAGLLADERESELDSELEPEPDPELEPELEPELDLLGERKRRSELVD